MRPQGRAVPSNAAEILAALSQVSTRQGDIALARAQLMECLSLAQSIGVHRSGAAALGAAAKLAVAVGYPERAVEFLGARERLLGSSQPTENPQASEERDQALDHLLSALGQDRFDAAWSASRATPFPFEFYVSVARHWLGGIDSSLLARPLPGSAQDGTMPASDSGSSLSTGKLIVQTQDGSRTAREKLAGRHLAALRRFAHGRLPEKSRDLLDTDDVVQVTVVRGLEQIGSIDPKRRGGFFAYLRQILVNQLRDLSRRSSRTRTISGQSEAIRSGAPSPLDELIERESLEVYKGALSRLSARQREAIVLRIEHGCSYQEVADEIGCASADAARMVVTRALTSVARTLRRS
jgi:RNA polymerase sigma factor (sigma-70 family)